MSDSAHIDQILRLSEDNERLRRALEKAYKFISPYYSPEGYANAQTNTQMAAEIRRVLDKK